MSGLYTPQGDLDLSIEGHATWCASPRVLECWWGAEGVGTAACSRTPALLTCQLPPPRRRRRDEAGRVCRVTVDDMSRDSKVKFLRVRGCVRTAQAVVLQLWRLGRSRA